MVELFQYSFLRTIPPSSLADLLQEHREREGIDPSLLLPCAGACVERKGGGSLLPLAA